MVKYSAHHIPHLSLKSNHAWFVMLASMANFKYSSVTLRLQQSAASILWENSTIVQLTMSNILCNGKLGIDCTERCYALFNQVVKPLLCSLHERPVGLLLCRDIY